MSKMSMYSIQQFEETCDDYVNGKIPIGDLLVFLKYKTNLGDSEKADVLADLESQKEAIMEEVHADNLRDEKRDEPR
jgi:hypothetical protein